MNIPTLIGLSGISLLLSVILLRIMLLLGQKKQTAYAFAILIFALSFIPVADYTINQYFRGLLNDLSISTLLLMGYYFVVPDNSQSQSRPLLAVIAITGLFFYPAALGLGPIDPYAWGFFNKAHGLLMSLIFLTALVGLMVFALHKKYTLMLACLALSALAYHLELLESRNLWDYLLDPVIFFYAFVMYLMVFIKKQWRVMGVGRKSGV